MKTVTLTCALLLLSCFGLFVILHTPDMFGLTTHAETQQP